jgi:hypothetical protein
MARPDRQADGDDPARGRDARENTRRCNLEQLAASFTSDSGVGGELFPFLEKQLPVERMRDMARALSRA